MTTKFTQDQIQAGLAEYRRQNAAYRRELARADRERALADRLAAAISRATFKGAAWPLKETWSEAAKDRFVERYLKALEAQYHKNWLQNFLYKRQVERDGEGPAFKIKARGRRGGARSTVALPNRWKPRRIRLVYFKGQVHGEVVGLPPVALPKMSKALATRARAAWQATADRRKRVEAWEAIQWPATVTGPQKEAHRLRHCGATTRPMSYGKIATELGITKNAAVERVQKAEKALESLTA